MEANANIEKGEYCIVAEVPAPAEAEEKSELTADLYMLSQMMNGMDEDEAADAALEAGFMKNAVKKAKIAIKRRFDL